MLFPVRKRLLTALLLAQQWPFQPSRHMRLVQFQAPHLVGPHLGLESGNGGGVINLNAFDPTLPRTMVEFLEQGESTLSVARRALAAQLPVLPRSEVTFLAPVTRPDKVVCVGMNYVDHCKEQNVPVPKEPIIFSKFASSIVGPYDEIILPPESQEVDWEVELAVVIGKKGKHIKVRLKGWYPLSLALGSDQLWHLPCPLPSTFGGLWLLVWDKGFVIGVGVIVT
ncbi:hypothetical protein HJG60_011238 [Phyllostomus discolor]|nr:hypothetical protein HJG60_011238 [Phyllostomus discolor]